MLAVYAVGLLCELASALEPPLEYNPSLKRSTQFLNSDRVISISRVPVIKRCLRLLANKGYCEEVNSSRAKEATTGTVSLC